MAQFLGFRKVMLRAGAATTVRITLDAGPTLQRDPASQRWSPARASRPCHRPAKPSQLSGRGPDAAARGSDR
ncbi:MAG TPA: hypothetical protein VF885_08450 [Arthrobacter sp.]